MIVIFCGSRSWIDREMIREELRKLPEGSTVIHGAAPGADSIAGWEAECMKLDVVPMPAFWDSLGDSAGPERNQRMLNLLVWAQGLGQEVKVIAFHEDPGLGSGTRDMVTRAKRAGILTDIKLLSAA